MLQCRRWQVGLLSPQLSQGRRGLSPRRRRRPHARGSTRRSHLPASWQRCVPSRALCSAHERARLEQGRQARQGSAGAGASDPVWPRTRTRTARGGAARGTVQRRLIDAGCRRQRADGESAGQHRGVPACADPLGDAQQWPARFGGPAVLCAQADAAGVSATWTAHDGGGRRGGVPHVAPDHGAG